MVSNPLKISNDLVLHRGQDLEGLRVQALERLQQFAPNTWTDHNRFDPGITLLEVLVYVLSDLSYKFSFPVEDLLSRAQSDANRGQQFLAPETVLFSHCVTADDYRRLFLDITEVKNVHVKDINTGTGSASDTFDLMIQLYQSSDEIRAQVISKIHQAFISNRTVNHQLGQIGFYGVEHILLTVSLDLNNVDDVVETLVDIFRLIDNEISPSVPQYTAAQLQQKNISLEQIYNGPKLNNGFVLDSDLANTAQKRHLYSSNILSVLDGHPHIANISEFKFITASSQQGYEYWQTKIPPNANGDVCLPALFFQSPLFFDAINITIEQQAYTLTTDEKVRIRAALDTFKSAPLNERNILLAPHKQGEHRPLSHYDSLQHELPKVFAVTEKSLDQLIDSGQKAQLLQFKGYLHLFDQILADQHKQLDVLPHILALPSPDSYQVIASLLDDMLASESINQTQCVAFWTCVNALPHSQLSQALQGISGLAHLITIPIETYQNEGMQRTLEAHFSLAQLTRLNRSTAHLLARFCITVPDPNSLKYQNVFALYRTELANNELDQSGEECLVARLVLLRQYIDKCRLLNEIGELGCQRGMGFNYLSRLPHCDQLAGLSKYIMRHIGLSHPGQMPLATNNKESFYLLESSLLNTDLKTGSISEQPLVTQLHFILPDWPTRFQNLEFRALVSSQIRMYTPLHQSAQSMWLDKETMSLFERLYYGWLNFYGEAQRSRFMQFNESVIAVAMRLNTLLKQFLRQPIDAASDSAEHRWMLASLIINETNEEADFETIKQVMYDILQTYSAQTLSDELEIDGVVLPEIHRSVTAIIANENFEFPIGFSADTVFYLTAQHCIDEICKPSLLDSANNHRRFTVGYTPLPYLTPISPVSLSKINPTSPEASKFTVAKSTANRI
ncbi:hypothetical protein J8L98_17565 [Pseudoalteromonas sp. MMG013]|uniref:hypothetical protein n=1 Tax=Pseudoalteromonas sp. MMG013 TaxID=2822687 RepID=UPI001B397534|nr:hypothetical protein [Pseudoalteromonas sp. MMG013]MBQ4863493.1 hypothetical protein [Pseudoalteromonas sp. MMG013]